MIKMNWKKDRYTGFKPGDKIIITGDEHSSMYHHGETYTLKEQYIKDGMWINRGVDVVLADTCKNNYWQTEEYNSGIEEKSMERVTIK